jgi:osmotically-inducible protein OsmY
VFVENRDLEQNETGQAAMDSALQQEVAHRLSTSPFVGLRRVRCDSQQGDLVLQGSVSSFYLKQMATAIGRQVAGVRAVRNELYVGMV